MALFRQKSEYDQTSIVNRSRQRHPSHEWAVLQEGIL